MENRIITEKGDAVQATKLTDNVMLVHGCNAVGHMNKGIAKQIRDEYPEVYDAYKLHQSKNGLNLGDVIPVLIGNNTFIVNAITQDKYAKTYYDKTVYVDYDAIEACFSQLSQLAEDNHIDAIFFPKIGCGLANGDWEEVKLRINRSVSKNIELVYWEY